jgi:hypothetical protein
MLYNTGQKQGFHRKTTIKWRVPMSTTVENKMNRRLTYLYVDRKLPTTKLPEEMRKRYGVEISESKCYRVLKELNLIRSQGEAVSISRSALDYDRLIMTDKFLSILDGLIIGDGSMHVNHKTKVARISIDGQHKEWIDYCFKLLEPYVPHEPGFYGQDRTNIKKGAGCWQTKTKTHPDLYKQYNRWYTEENNRVKDIPWDMGFSPMMMMLWYLGDGCLSDITEKNSRYCYFSTNSFKRESIEDILVPQFEGLGISVKRITPDNRLFIATESIPTLLEYMSPKYKSPVKCYQYKFDLEDWRKKRTMKETATELVIDYQKLASLVKTGKVSHSRSPGGKKVLFSKQEFIELQERLDSGEIAREKGKQIRGKRY